uniref:Uncharacterized protein n=1 Tax=Tanacetum cinerariifolium TaxID=118510 RepID=A0A699GW21_TANCI|nr:hypothetical protein [Tanacetum cinerariifolium]
MAVVNDVPQLVDKKGGSYAAISLKLEPRKFNKWIKRMLCYLAGMEPYYLKCIKDGPFQPKTAEVNNFSSVSKGFQPNFTPKLIQSSPNSNSQTNLKFQKDYKAEYKKMKAKLTLLTVSPSSPQNPKTFQPKNKGLVVEIFDWDEEEVTQVKVLMVLADDELTVGKNHARNGEWVDITMKKMLIDEKVNSKQKTQESTSKIQKTELSKSVDSIRMSQDFKPKVQNTGSSKSLRPKRIQKPQLKCELCHYTNHSIDDCYKILCYIICKKEDHRTSDHEMYIASLKRSENYKAQPYHYASTSKQILKAKEKPFPPCTHCGFNDHRSDDCRNYPECEIYGSYDHFTSRHNQALYIPPLTTMSLITSKEVRKSRLQRLGSPPKTRLSYLNFYNINKLAIQNKVLGLPSLVYSKDKPCTSCEKEKHHRASFKAKQNFSIRKCLHRRHMELFGPVSPMFINHEKYTLIIIDEHSRERIHDISYFHMFGCHVFIHNHNDHLSKFNAKADDRYFLGYYSVSKAFRVYNTRRQQIEETYHVTFDESIEAIKFTNTSVDKIGIDDSSRYRPDKFQEDDPSRQYQVDYDFSYYIIPYGRSFTEITQENHVPEVIAPNEPEIPHTKDNEGPPDLINTEGIYEQNIKNDQMITQPTNAPSGNNIEGPGPITKPLVPDVTHEGMLTRIMAAKLTATSASECLFADFLSKIEPKKVSEALKHPGWIDSMQEELNQFYKNKVWTLVPLPCEKITIGSKWVFRNKKDKHGITTKNKKRLVAQGYSQKKKINYDETFASLARMESIRIFLAFATYMNFKVYQMNVKSAFLNDKLKEEVYVKQPPGFESSERRSLC